MAYVFILDEFEDENMDRWSRKYANYTTNTRNFFSKIIAGFWKNTYEESVQNMNEFADRAVEIIKLWFIQHDNYFLQIVGHGLGAHIAGMIGDKLKGTKRVSQIIALDPSRYLFEGVNGHRHLSADDAEQVVVFHTNPGKYGYEGTLGDWDFYRINVTSNCLSQPKYPIQGSNGEG